jgi:hypothetical protein
VPAELIADNNESLSLIRRDGWGDEEIDAAAEAALFRQYPSAAAFFMYINAGNRLTLGGIIGMIELLF